MLFLTGMRPALGWVVLCLLGWMEGARAAQLVAFEPPASVVHGRLALSAEERQWIEQHPQVTVAAVQFPLYVFKDEQGQWSGLNTDILKRISRMTGLQFVYEESFSTAQLLEALESGSAHLSTTLAVNDERKAFLNFSHAYGGSGWVFVERQNQPPVQSLAHLEGKVLVLPARHALEELVRRDYPRIRLRSVQTSAEARALVESGEAWATIENETGAHLYPAGQLAVGRVVEGKWEPDHLALRKDLPQLLGILNKALATFSAEEMRALRRQWLDGVAPRPAPSTWQQLTEWGCWGVFGAGVFGWLSLLWNRRLKAQIEQRLTAEAELRDQLAFQKALMDAMPDPIFIRDLQGRLIMCNRSYEEQLVTRFEQVQGTSLLDTQLLPRATAEQLHRELMEQIRTRRSRFGDRRLGFLGGVREVYQWSVPFYGADGQLRGLLGGWIDAQRRRSDPEPYGDAVGGVN
ncbi:transporter substrate-binding domain-containing protein [Pseudomonas sp. SZMC_28357]|uniref:transporter substrate-binding domain-containing protein n=1 Tax=Pseudomonas sp. SZMC_28357 TaxID=3074380 RepID=UPI002871393D|nr:transporter substrate-binding domain-containing protein [Pseudomonas sp. SZMC_28357]MDR9755120.1 transporter substrate-binding domain-containing protein [Pseudomonas sp. SZMC_28357]